MRTIYSKSLVAVIILLLAGFFSCTDNNTVEPEPEPEKDLTLISDHQNASYQVGDTVDLKAFAKSNTVGSIEFKFSRDGGETWVDITTSDSINVSPPDTVTFKWVVPDSILLSNNTKLSVVTDSGMFAVREYADLVDPDSSKGFFSVSSPSDTTDETANQDLNLISDHQNASYQVGDTVEIKAFAKSNTVGSIVFNYSKDGGNTWVDITTSESINVSPPETVTFKWVVPDSVLDLSDLPNITKVSAVTDSGKFAVQEYDGLVDPDFSDGLFSVLP